jgi:hypothetical protein
MNSYEAQVVPFTINVNVRSHQYTERSHHFHNEAIMRCPLKTRKVHHEGIERVRTTRIRPS